LSANLKGLRTAAFIQPAQVGINSTLHHHSILLQSSGRALLYMARRAALIHLRCPGFSASNSVQNVLPLKVHKVPNFSTLS